MLPRWRLPSPFLKTRGDLDAQKRKKTAKEVASPACCERAAELVWVHQPAQYPHPCQHVPRGACPTTPTDRAFDVYNSTPSDFKPPIPRSNPVEACPCPASACSRLAIDFLAHRPRQEQALFNGLLIGREAEEGCAEAQLTRGQASCLLCLPPPSVFFLPECNGVGKALGLVLWPGLSATRDLLLTHRMTWDKASSSAARWEEIVLGGRSEET